MTSEFEKLLVKGKPYHKTIKQICEEINDLADEGYEIQGPLTYVDFPIHELIMLVEYINMLEKNNAKDNVRSIK